MNRRQQEFLEEIAKNALKFSKLLESVSTVDTNTEQDWAGAKVREGWKRLVKCTASEGMRKALIVCNRAVKWQHEESKEAIEVMREAHARCMSSKIRYDERTAPKLERRCKKMVEKKKGNYGEM